MRDFEDITLRVLKMHIQEMVNAILNEELERVAPESVLENDSWNNQFGQPALTNGKRLKLRCISQRFNNYWTKLNKKS